VCLRASGVEKSDLDFQVQRLADNIIIVCTLILDFSARTSTPLLLAHPSSFVPPTTPEGLLEARYGIAGKLLNSQHPMILIMILMLTP